MKKLSLLLALLLLALSLASCNNLLVGTALAAPKDFTVEELTFTLNTSFTEQSSIDVNQTAVFLSTKTCVLVLRESFDSLESANLNTDMSLTEYAAIIMKNGSVKGDPITENGLTYFTYAATSDGTDFTYLATVFRSDSAYWLVQFYCPSSNFKDIKPDMLAYAASVTFDTAES